MLLISSSLSLIAIVAGMFLYAKAIRDGLSRFFKFVACFIIIVGFLNLFIGHAFFTIKSIYKCGSHHNKMKMMWHGHHGKKMKKHCCKYMSMYCKDEDNSNCEDKIMEGHEMMEGKGCMMEGKSCSSMMEMDEKSMMNKKPSCMKGNMMMKNDSVKVKK